MSEEQDVQIVVKTRKQINAKLADSEVLKIREKVDAARGQYRDEKGLIHRSEEWIERRKAHLAYKIEEYQKRIELANKELTSYSA